MILDSFVNLVNTIQFLDNTTTITYHINMNQPNQVLLPEEVAKILGVSRMTIKRYLDSKKDPLPHIKLGHKTIRVVRGQLDNWLLNKMVK